MAAYGTGNQPAAMVPTGGVAGWGSWNLPNFVGELYKLSPLETPLVSLLGGANGGMIAEAIQFVWQDTLHRQPALSPTDRGRIEGDDAPFQVQSRSERTNVCEIFQYGVELSYSKQAATGLLGTSGTSPATGAENILGVQPVQNEMAWQLQIKLENAVLDMEISYLDGTLAYPNDGTARQTQGIRGAITTVTKDAQLAADWDAGTGAPLLGTELVNETAQAMFDNGAPMRNCIIMVGGKEKRLIASDFQQGNGNIAPRSYNRFGVNITEIETDFGLYPIVLNRHCTAEEVLYLELNVMETKHLPIPGKGFFFMEPLAKSGSYDRHQLYGEAGLEYGPEGWHAKVTNFDGTTNLA